MVKCVNSRMGASNSCFRGAGRVPHTKPLHNIEATIMGSLSVKVREVVLAAAARGPSLNFRFCHENAKSGKPQA